MDFSQAGLNECILQIGAPLQEMHLTCGGNCMGGFVMQMTARFQIPWAKSVDLKQEQPDKNRGP